MNAKQHHLHAAASLLASTAPTHLSSSLLGRLLGRVRGRGELQGLLRHGPLRDVQHAHVHASVALALAGGVHWLRLTSIPQRRADSTLRN